VTDGGRRKVTGDGALHFPGIWETDRTLVSVQGTPQNVRLTRLSSSGTGDPEVLAAVPSDPWLAGWSANPKSLIFWTAGPRNAKASGFYVLPIDGPQRTLQPVDEMGRGGPGLLSPDGRWMAYSASDGTRREVYVQSWPDGRIRKTISTSGGRDPRWRRHGGELFYLANGGEDDYLAAVTVRASADNIEWDTPHKLFEYPVRRAQFYQWDVTADGQRFVTLLPIVSAEPDKLVVTAHWRRR
jgi:hypothetical protein